MASIRQHRFKLVGGHPALNFLNTVHDWTVDEPHDYLCEFADAVRFGEAAGLLSRTEALRLKRGTSHIELVRLRALRALLRRVFLKSFSSEAPSGTDLGRLSADLVEAARAAQLVVVTQTHRSRQAPMRREITAEKAGHKLLRFRIVEAAVALLVSDAMLRVKSCPACGWLFLDVSKNQSRRWCSMDTCGSIAKARSHYQRLKARAESLTEAVVCFRTSTTRPLNRKSPRIVGLQGR